MREDGVDFHNHMWMFVVGDVARADDCEFGHVRDRGERTVRAADRTEQHLMAAQVELVAGQNRDRRRWRELAAEKP